MIEINVHLIACTYFIYLNPVIQWSDISPHTLSAKTTAAAVLFKTGRRENDLEVSLFTMSKSLLGHVRMLLKMAKNSNFSLGSFCDTQNPFKLGHLTVTFNYNNKCQLYQSAILGGCRCLGCKLGQIPLASQTGEVTSLILPIPNIGTTHTWQPGQ